MKKAMLVVMFVLAVGGLVMAQNYSSPIDVLGAHNNNGRGCAGCHQPHSGSFGSGHKGVADTGTYALWGQDASPLYGATVSFGDNGSYTEVLPNGIATGTQAVGGIRRSRSAHEGTAPAHKMMANQSYKQAMGLQKNPAYATLP